MIPYHLPIHTDETPDACCSNPPKGVRSNGAIGSREQRGMMWGMKAAHIGKPERVITIEPLEIPEPSKVPEEPDYDPAPEPTPVPEQEPVPA